MAFVATLIANPDRPAITPALLEEAARRLRAIADPAILAHGIAADLRFEADRPAAAESELREALAPAGLDVVVQREENRRKRLFLADMDSTMIGQECIDELADLVGLKAGVAAITERAMRGEIAFEPALRERVALLKGLPVGVVERLLDERIKPTPGAATLVATMKANGAYTCLVSGGFTAFTGPVGARIGFDEDRGNVLLHENGTFTGFVSEPILGREAKLATLVDLRERLRIGQGDSMAVGDGANDLSMLRGAGIGVAFRAKPAVAAACHARIDHGDLTALLYMQGYRRDEFVTG
jgi:phosphoserine phosphatase